MSTIIATQMDQTEISSLPVIEGMLFLIPNLALSPSNYHGQEAYDQLVEEHVLTSAKVLDLRTHNLSEDRMVQVWVHSPVCENWVDHIHPVIGRFPSHIPATWLEGVKEGDVLTIVGHRAKMVLRCQQVGFRYGRFGTFEEVLERVNKDYVKS